jgi:lysophospholipase L1-like esterase
VTSVYVLGDSVAAGQGAIDGAHGFPHTMATRLGWTLTLDGVGGTGYTSPGSNAPFYGDPSRLNPLIAAACDYVMIQGGEVVDVPTVALTATEATRICQAILAAQPATKIILLGWLMPVSIAASTPWLQWSAGMGAVAASVGGRFIDPLALGWLTGSGRSGTPAGDGNADAYRGPDGTHPAQAGHDYLGTRVAFALRPPTTGLDY